VTREGEGRLTMALALVAATCVFAFHRVFSGGAWLVPSLAAAWGSIALTRWLAHLRLALRRRRRAELLDGIGAAVILLVAGALFVLEVVFPSATSVGIPTLHTIRVALDAIGSARRAIAGIIAPVSPDPGFLAMAMATAWIAGILSGALLGAPIRSGSEGAGVELLAPSLLAPLPWVVLFTIAAGVGQGGSAGRLIAVGLFFAALVAFLLAEGWRATTRVPKLDGIMRLGVLSLAGALLLPNIVPGYRAGPVFSSLKVGPSTETTISPLVKIQPLLLNQSNETLFHVDATLASYWRLTSLNIFDGNTWSSEGRYNPASGVLGTPVPGVASQQVRQNYRIASLGGIWVPAAYFPTRVRGISTELDASTSTLIVGSSSALAPGDSYSVSSSEPEPTGPELASAGAGDPPSSEDLQLPLSTTALISPIAHAIVQPTDGTAFQEAVAIQDYLRTFTYDARVPPGSSTNYLYTFLTQTKRGYCEQFAGAMAVMLRTLGIPSRVAVGFLPGTAAGSSGGLTTFTVTGTDAHAWPEAYFGGIGWVAFEPTPREGVQAPPYTVPPGPTVESTPGSAPTPETTSGPGSPAASAQPRHVPSPAGLSRPSTVPVTAARRAADDLVAALLAIVLLLIAARELRLRAPAWLARSPQEKAVAAYDEFRLRASDAAGGRKSPGETAAEYGRGIVQRLGIPPGPVVAVTRAYEQAAFGRHGPGDAAVADAVAANRSLRRLLWKRADWRGRLRLLASPRPLFTRMRTPPPPPPAGQPARPVRAAAPRR
jgi:transglutaminase-like putative cysteine protease